MTVFSNFFNTSNNKDEKNNNGSKAFFDSVDSTNDKSHNPTELIMLEKIEKECENEIVSIGNFLTNNISKYILDVVKLEITSIGSKYLPDSIDNESKFDSFINDFWKNRNKYVYMFNPDEAKAEINNFANSVKDADNKFIKDFKESAKESVESVVSGTDLIMFNYNRLLNLFSEYKEFAYGLRIGFIKYLCNKNKIKERALAVRKMLDYLNSKNYKVKKISFKSCIDRPPNVILDRILICSFFNKDTIEFEYDLPFMNNSFVKYKVNKISKISVDLFNEIELTKNKKRNRST